MQLLSSGRTTQCPSSIHVPAGPGDMRSYLQPDPVGGSMWSFQVPIAPLLLLPWFGVPPSAGLPPRAPGSAGRHPCPVLAVPPAVNSQGWGQARFQAGLWGESGEKQEGVSWWLAPSFDLGPPSLSPDASWPLGELLSIHPAPITSAPIALLWIRVKKEGVRMQSPRLQPQRSGPGGLGI